MSEFLSINNFKKAGLLGLVMCLLSAPRILTSDIYSLRHVIYAFAALTLLSATVTAWGKSAGMKGLFPSAQEALQGLKLAALIVILFFPIKVLWFNPALYAAVESTGNAGALILLFPETLFAGIALTLWVMSFETLFFQAAAISFFGRLSRHFLAALILSTLFRGYVSWLKLGNIGVETAQFLILSHALIINVISCILFARYGLPASMLFIGGISIYRWTFLWG